MSFEPYRFSYASMGTQWNITLWDTDPAMGERLRQRIIAQSQEFDRTYSRFIKTSLIWSLTTQLGVVGVPADLVQMLRLYARLYDASGGKCNPLVGFALSDLGYDADYTLTPKEVIRPVPEFHNALRIVDDTHIDLSQSVLIDLGALGKGYFVDTIAAILQAEGVVRFLVDGSGDVFYRGNGQPIRCGLEHPGDPTKAIGVVTMTDGALCASASNRRRWDKYHHTIDPFSLSSPEQLLATWVMADTAALADGLCTCLFLCEPATLVEEFRFEYCTLNPDYHAVRSPGFTAELF